MSQQRDRYLASVCLAQMILEQPAANDERLLAEAEAVLRAEVEAGRANQAAFPVVSAELFDQLSNGSTRPTPKLRVVDSAGFSVRVEPKEAS